MDTSICIAHGERLGLESGGTVRVVSLAKSLADNGFDVHLVAPKPSNANNIPDGLDEINFHPVSVSANGIIDQLPRAFLISKKAKKITQQHNAMLQIERGTLAGVATLLGCSNYIVDLHDIGFNGPLFSSLPLSIAFKKFVYQMEKRGVQHAKRVIAVSNGMKQFVKDEWGVPDDSVDIIYNGVRSNILEFIYEEEEVDGMISFIGSLNYNIDYEKILKLALEVKNVNIHIIGKGYKLAELAKAVRNKGINNITVHGFLPDKDAYSFIRQSQVCIFPVMNTHHTKMAQHMKCLDYGAFGKAIATDRDGTANILEEHKAALVSDPGNPDEFVENVRQLLNNKKLRKQLGENAKKLVKDFTWEEQGKKLVEIYTNE